MERHEGDVVFAFAVIFLGCERTGGINPLIGKVEEMAQDVIFRWIEEVEAREDGDKSQRDLPSQSLFLLLKLLSRLS